MAIIRPSLAGRPEFCRDLLRYPDAIFPGFARETGSKPRFRVGGVAAGAAMLGAQNARDIWLYYSEQKKGKVLGWQIIQEETKWTKEFAFAWGGNLNYPTFLKAWKGEPILFFKGAQVLAAFEAAAINLGGGDIYSVMDIIPCSYNVDKFNTNLLAELRQIAPEGDNSFDARALKAMGQTDVELLNELANGSCVTKESATSLRSFVKAYIERSNRTHLQIGEVRAFPGKKKLGRGSASELEIVDTDSPKP